MNSLTRIMSYDKTKGNQESCNCEEYVSVENTESKSQTVEYSKLSKEEIEKIISERYSNKDEKTKTFIRKALKIHGDKYDYFKTVYIKSKEKVIIICREHREFWQIPSDHLNKHGCYKCGVKKQIKQLKLTTEEFIKRANKIHGKERYDYSKVKYKNIDIKICIICHKHNNSFEFWQTPNSHLHNNGCPICAKNKKLTTKEFIERARKIHGDKYDYSKAEYKNTDVKICIICKEHKKPFEFWQTPHRHLNNQGCPKCRSSKGEIIVRNFLIENKINFEEQKKFNNCKFKRKLPFDFYLPQYNLCIEFDGKQHFIPRTFSSKITEEEKLKNFKQLQLRDQIKNNYCEEKEINLLRIRYDENIEEKLVNYFQKHGIIKELTIFDL